MGGIKLQRVMPPHLRPLTKTRSTIKALRLFPLSFFFHICLRILINPYIYIYIYIYFKFVEFSLFHVLPSVPKNYYKQCSRNILKVKKSSIK